MRHNEGVRVAWFSPLPPDPSGIAAYSAELVPHLRPRLESLDLYTAARSGTAAASAGRAAPVHHAHDFVWRHRRDPYDVIVYQLGNAATHDFMWGYLFRYPGLVVLHDAQLHQARALGLLSRANPRLTDYLAELHANHPEAPAELGRLIAAGLGGRLYRLWPLVSLVIRSARLTAVHSSWLAAALDRQYPDSAVREVPMGVADPRLSDLRDQTARAEVRARHGVPANAVVVAAYGGVTPEKRIPQLLAALAGPLRTAPVHVLLVGQPAAHYDAAAEVQTLGLSDRVHLTGYVSDHELSDYLAAADLAWCLRWPSNGETSASWLRCLAAGLPTLTTALAQLREVPTHPAYAELPPVGGAEAMGAAVGLSIDPVDEMAEIGVAVSRLAERADLRLALGANARRWWQSHHTLAQMSEAYRELLAEAAARPAPQLTLPRHLVEGGTSTATRLLAEVGIRNLPW